MNLSEPFIRRPVMTAVLTLSVILFGTLAYLQLPVNDLPVVDYPVIQVNVVEEVSHRRRRHGGGRRRAGRASGSGQGSRRARRALRRRCRFGREQVRCARAAGRLADGRWTGRLEFSLEQAADVSRRRPFGQALFPDKVVRPNLAGGGQPPEFHRRNRTHRFVIAGVVPFLTHWGFPSP